MRRLLLLVLVCAAGFVAGGADAATSLRLTQAGGAQFPDRQFVVGFPTGVRVPADQIRVVENGAPVSHLSVLPVGSAGRHAFGVVLAIDASNSMRGAALARARDAAIAFVTDQERFTHQQVAIVYFNNKARVAVPFTNDSETLVRVLETPVRTASETHIYDAIATSASLLARHTSRLDRSSFSPTAPIRAAGSGRRRPRAQRTRRTPASSRSVSARGRSGRRPSGRWQRVTRRVCGGSLRNPARGDLSRASSQLAGEYLLRYRSAAAANQHVHVTVTVDGGQAFGTASTSRPRSSPRRPPASSVPSANASGSHRSRSCSSRERSACCSVSSWWRSLGAIARAFAAASLNSPG